MRDFLLVALSYLFWGTGEGLFLYFQPLYLQELGATPALIGLIMGLVGVTMTIVQAPVGIIADRIGNRKVMLFGWIEGAFCALIMALAPNLLVFSIGYVLYGFSFCNAASVSYVTKVRGKLSLQRALTIASAVYSLGAFLGPIFGGQIAEHLGLKSLYAFSAVLFAISSVVVYLLKPDAVEPHDPEQPRSNILQNRRFILLLAVCFVTIFSGYLAEPLTSNYLQNEQHLSFTQIGFLGSIGSLGNAVIALVFGGRSPFAGILIGHAALSMFSLIMWKGSGMGLYAVGFFLRGGYRIYQSMYMAITRTLTRPAEMGRAYGILSTGNAIAIILAPMVAGLLYEVKPYLMYPVALSLVGLTFVINLVCSKFLIHKEPQPVEGNG
jgi:MFS family permease